MFGNGKLRKLCASEIWTYTVCVTSWFSLDLWYVVSRHLTYETTRLCYRYMFVVLTLCSETFCVTYEWSVIETEEQSLWHYQPDHPISKLDLGWNQPLAIMGAPSLAWTVFKSSLVNNFPVYFQVPILSYISFLKKCLLCFIKKSKLNATYHYHIVANALTSTNKPM